jgi:hypothetical protein
MSNLTPTTSENLGEDYETIGEISVDSGMVAICDPCSFASKDWAKELATFNDEAGFTDGDGFVMCRTVHGDGVYPVVAVKQGGRIVRLIVDLDPVDDDFLDEDDDA